MKSIPAEKVHTYSEKSIFLAGQMSDLILPNHNIIKNLSTLKLIPIINGLSDYSHPCQILSDLFTITEKLGDIKNNY